MEGIITCKNGMKTRPVDVTSNVHVEKKSYSPMNVKTEGNSFSNNCRPIVALVQSVKSEHDVTTLNSEAGFPCGTRVDTEKSTTGIKVEADDAFTFPVEASVLVNEEREYQTNIIHDLVNNYRAISSGKCEDYECENVNFRGKVIHNDTSESNTNESHCEGGRVTDFRGSDFTITANENLSLEHRTNLNSNADGSRIKLLDATVVHKNIFSKNTRKHKTAENKSHCKDDCRPVSVRDAVSMMDSENPSIEHETHSRRIVDWSQMKFLCVSVALVDLFSDSARKRGEGHINDRACSCIYCQGKFKLSSASKKQIKCQKLENHNKNAMKPSGLDCAADLNDECHLPRHLGLHPDGKQFSSMECRKTFKKKYDLQGHSSSNRKYTCADCGAKFNVKQILINHMLVHKDEKPFSCHICPLKLKRKRSLIRHLAVHLSGSEKKYSCPHCGAKFSVKQALGKHMVVHGNVKLFSCIICPRKFQIKQSLIRHLAVHGSVKKYGCEHCPAIFRQKDNLKRHLSRCCNVKLFKCSQCPAKFRTKCSLGKHSRCHIEAKFECAHCGAKFKQKGNIRRHLIGFSDATLFDGTDVPFPCSYYYQVFKAESSHLPYGCAECSLKFKSRSRLIAHFLVHSDEKPFACSQCSVKCKRKSELKVHMATHSNEKPFACAECPAKFKVKRCLRVHLERHFGEKRFECSVCSFKFFTRRELKGHELTHKEKKATLACTSCPLMFKSKISLETHIRTHTDERPFTCDVCPCSFRSYASLRTHKAFRRHSSEKFSCTVCSAEFFIRSQLYEHYRLKKCHDY